jgi:hypothetical protein
MKRLIGIVAVATAILLTRPWLAEGWQQKPNGLFYCLLGWVCIWFAINFYVYCRGDQ